MQVHGVQNGNHLLDVVAITTLLLSVVEPAAATLITPSAAAPFNANGVRGLAGGQGRRGLSAVDGHHVAGEIVLAAEGAATRLMVASVGLKTVRVVRLDVRLEVVGAGKRYSNRMN